MSQAFRTVETTLERYCLKHFTLLELTEGNRFSKEAKENTNLSSWQIRLHKTLCKIYVKSNRTR